MYNTSSKLVVKYFLEFVGYIFLIMKMSPILTFEITKLIGFVSKSLYNKMVAAQV